MQVQVTVSFEVTVGSAQLMLVDREHGTTAKTIRYIVAVSILFCHVGIPMFPFIHVMFHIFLFACVLSPRLSFCVSYYHSSILPFPIFHTPILPFHSLEYPNSSKDTLEADQHSKVVMKFTLLNRDTRKSVRVHQVRLS